MFLNILKKRNSKLIKTSLEMYQEGEILPDTYVLDVDSILENAKLMVAEARKYNIKLYGMTKQIGRIPYIAKNLIELGFDGIVPVDFKECLRMIENNIPLGNVGHLVQIPSKLVDLVVKNNPEIITVYSIEKIIEINEAALKYAKVQDIMLKVIDKNSVVYSGQAGGFYIDEIEEVVKEISKYKNVRINGLTAFPCFLYNKETNRIEKTENVNIINRCKEKLNKIGVEVEQLNMASATSIENIVEIKNNGGTHGEPGHSLTGTTPFNALNLSGEMPAILYISEVSHNLDDKSYFYGGGHYRRSGIENAFVGFNFETLKTCKVNPPTMESIDYYFELDKNFKVGEPVVTSFRTQIFVTRSSVALIEGIQNGNPRLIGTYDNLGRMIK